MTDENPKVLLAENVTLTVGGVEVKCASSCCGMMEECGMISGSECNWTWCHEHGLGKSWDAWCKKHDVRLGVDGIWRVPK